MKTYLWLLSGAVLLSAGCVGAPQASAESPVPVVVAPPPPAEKGSLDELVAPIALYPDVLIALILPASTTSSDVVLAARYLAGGGDRAQLQAQQWDDSVKALAHYPDVVKWMDENLSWTQRLGEAYLDEPQEVMAAIQRDRARARASGALVDTEQQQIVVAEGNIRIIPAQPEVIYVPRYDPQIVYVERPVYYYSPDPWLTFGIGFGVGSWLAYDCDWGARTIWIDHHRHERWRDHREDWRHPHFPNRPEHGAYQPGWQRWKPSPERYVEHRRHLDRQHRNNPPSHPIVRTPDRGRDHRPDQQWQDRDRRPEPSPRNPNDRRARPDRVPDVAGRPHQNPPAAQPTVSNPPSRPTLDTNRRPERDVSTPGWKHGAEPNRDGRARRDGETDRHTMRNPSHSQGRPGVAGAPAPAPRRADPAMTPSERHPAPQSMHRPDRVHTAPPPAAIAPRAPSVTRPAAPAPARTVESRPSPSVRHERVDRSDQRSERAANRGAGRDNAAKETDR